VAAAEGDVAVVVEVVEVGGAVSRQQDNENELSVCFFEVQTANQKFAWP
jgi:hypothetical protein